MGGCSFEEIAITASLIAQGAIGAGVMAAFYGGPVLETMGVIASTCIAYNALQHATIKFSRSNGLNSSTFYCLRAASDILVSESCASAATSFGVLGHTAATALRIVGAVDGIYWISRGLGCHI